MTSNVRLVGGGIPPLALAKVMALLVPLTLLAGAYGSEYLGGLLPCEMCYWQRWAHMAGVAFAAIALAAGRLPDRGRTLVWLAAAAIFVSGAIGFYHAGVEAGYFEGFTQCTSTASGASPDELIADILSKPLIRCDDVQWAWLGISMAGWNAILSVLTALVVVWLSLRRSRTSD